MVVVHGDKPQLDTVASQIADDFLAHRPSGTASIRTHHLESRPVPESDEFSPALAALAITYESLFKDQDRNVLQHELAVLRTEITNEHFTAAALRVGRSLEYIVYAACRSWGVLVREPVLAALQRLEDRFEELRAALLKYSAAKDDGKGASYAKGRVMNRAHAIPRVVQDIVSDIDESVTAKHAGSSVPRNIQVMLTDIRKRHARLPEVCKNIDQILQGDRPPITQLLKRRNAAAHASVDGTPRETSPRTMSRAEGVSPGFPPRDHALVKAVACAQVAETQQPLSRQSLADVTARAQHARGTPISRSTVWRMPATDAIKPWRYKYWIFPRAPHFAEKAGPILDLDAGTWQGQPLGPQDDILSADEQPSIQAHHRCHPPLPPAPGRPACIEYAYERCGAVQYLAAWDVRRGYVLGRCEPTTGLKQFGRLVDQVLAQNRIVPLPACSGWWTTARRIAAKPRGSDCIRSTPALSWSILLTAL